MLVDGPMAGRVVRPTAGVAELTFPAFRAGRVLAATYRLDADVWSFAGWTILGVTEAA